MSKDYCDDEFKIEIRAKDLMAHTSDLMDAVFKLDRRNKEKIFRFLVNLIETGGENQTQSAVLAGFGAPTEEGRKVASVEAARLLADVKIKLIYEEMLRRKFLAKYITKLLQKEDVIAMHLHIAENCKDIKPGCAQTSLKEISLLAGFYDKDNSDNERLKHALETIADNSKAINNYQSMHREVDEKTKSMIN